MKNFSKKSILQKTIIAIVVTLLLTNFMAPTIILAEDEIDMDEVGGVLFSPIQFLVLGIGDTLLWLANTCAYG